MVYDFTVMCSNETCKNYTCPMMWVGRDARSHSIICKDLREECGRYSDTEIRHSIYKVVIQSEDY